MTPHWEDVCHHGIEFYVGTFSMMHRITAPTVTWNEQYYDVYVFWTQRMGRCLTDVEVCIRYGNEGGEYISPGRLLEFASRVRGNEVYERALRLIQEEGYATYQKRNVGKNVDTMA